MKLKPSRKKSVSFKQKGKIQFNKVNYKDYQKWNKKESKTRKKNNKKPNNLKKERNK